MNTETGEKPKKPPFWCRPGVPVGRILVLIGMDKGLLDEDINAFYVFKLSRRLLIWLMGRVLTWVYCSVVLALRPPKSAYIYLMSVPASNKCVAKRCRSQC